MSTHPCRHHFEEAGQAHRSCVWAQTSGPCCTGRVCAEAVPSFPASGAQPGVSAGRCGQHEQGVQVRSCPEWPLPKWKRLVLTAVRTKLARMQSSPGIFLRLGEPAPHCLAHRPSLPASLAEEVLNTVSIVIPYAAPGHGPVGRKRTFRV